MARYVISYDIGSSEQIVADKVEVQCDDGIQEYVFTSGTETIALVPRGNVLSVVRQDNAKAVEA